MIRDIHDPSAFRQVVNAKVAQWKSIDGQPGDCDPRPDFVELHSKDKVINAFVSPKQLIERTESTDPRYQYVSLLDVDRPRFFHAGGAKEMSRSAAGSVQGEQLQYDYNSGFSFFTHESMSYGDSEQSFMIADARLTRSSGGGNVG